MQQSHSHMLRLTKAEFRLLQIPSIRTLETTQNILRLFEEDCPDPDVHGQALFDDDTPSNVPEWAMVFESEIVDGEQTTPRVSWGTHKKRSMRGAQ
jgi:hypothetical protein